jgi:hypothetical protein
MDVTLSTKLARRISLRQQQVFAAVARLLRYTRAAEGQFLTQPTVSIGKAILDRR